MAIKVRFDKDGFHHPAYGRLGRGKDAGRVYLLPDQFGEKEEHTIDIMDNSSKPPRKVGEKKVTRYKYLPRSAEIIGEDVVEELTAAADEGDPDAAEELDAIKKAMRPAVATEEQLAKVTGGPKRAKAQGAEERTTGRRRSARKAAPVE
jgi:hypothetical protein